MTDILADLMAMNQYLKATRPKNYIDLILSTHCPTGTDKGLRVEYKDTIYLIMHFAAVWKMEASIPTTTGGIGGIPLVSIAENEGLVREILAYVHAQPGFELADAVREWVFGEDQSQNNGG